jgi:hypothetical protein
MKTATTDTDERPRASQGHPPKTPKKRTKLRRILFVLALLVIALAAYIVVISAFFRTPKVSYWIDDDTYGNARYLHFKAGNDAWHQLIPCDPPQPVQNSYRLAIVEVDEFGDFFQSEKYPDRAQDYQFVSARQMLTEAASTDNKPVLLFLLVHGWRNDASRDNETLALFKNLLSHLAQTDALGEFTVCGVYLAWRGASVKSCGVFTWPAEAISFWGRKAVAEKISSTCASSVIFGLIDTARKVAPTSGPEHKPARIVLAGHSLGAGILMNSVSQALTYDFVRNTQKTDTNATVRLESPANLILLLNPAFESVYLRQLRVSMKPDPGTKLYPWIVSLTSETDFITKHIFPLAQNLRVTSEPRKAPYLEVPWNNYNPSNPSPAKPTPVSQNVYATQTPGHNAYMRDLHLRVHRQEPKVLEKLKVDFPNFTNVVAYNTLYGGHEYFLLKHKTELPWFGYFDRVRPATEIHPLFWVATVDRMIMNGHGLPFDDTVRLDNFVGTVMALMVDSRVKHDTLPSTAEFSPVQSSPGQSRKK